MRLRHILILNASLLAINEAWLDFWSYPIVVFGSVFILFAALICGILIIISSFSLPSGQVVDITKAQQAKENGSVAVAGTLSFTIKMADQEDIVLRRWESRLLRVATWIVELTYNFTSVGS